MEGLYTLIWRIHLDENHLLARPAYHEQDTLDTSITLGKKVYSFSRSLGDEFEQLAEEKALYDGQDYNDPANNLNTSKGDEEEDKDLGVKYDVPVEIN